MKKFFVLILICMLFICSASTAMAQIIPPDVAVPYSEASVIVPSFLIDSSGVANIEILVRTVTGTNVDAVNGTIRIVNVGTGAIPATWNSVNFTEYISGTYKYQTTYRLPSRGVYNMEVTLYLRDGNTLVETLSLSPVTDAY